MRPSDLDAGTRLTGFISLDDGLERHYLKGITISSERFRVRTSLSLILVVLLATCPIVCGTAHAGISFDEGHAHGHDGRSGLPAPANDDDCLCNGALKTADITSTFGVDSDWQPMPFAMVAEFYSSLLLPLAVVSVDAPTLDLGRHFSTARRAILRC